MPDVAMSSPDFQHEHEGSGEDFGEILSTVFDADRCPALAELAG